MTPAKTLMIITAAATVSATIYFVYHGATQAAGTLACLAFFSSALAISGDL